MGESTGTIAGFGQTRPYPARPEYASDGYFIMAVGKLLCRDLSHCLLAMCATRDNTHDFSLAMRMTRATIVPVRRDLTLDRMRNTLGIESLVTQKSSEGRRRDFALRSRHV